MDIYSLPLKQKKICRKIIDNALQKQCKGFIETLSDILIEFKGNEKAPLENYHRIYKIVNSFDKLIADTYDDLTRSKYFITIVSLHLRGVLDDKDLLELDEDLQEKIKLFPI